MKIKEEKKEIKAKNASLWAQIIGALWIAGWHAALFIKDIFAGNQIKTESIVLSGVAIAACFTPVYFNLIMDKIKEMKLGGQND